MARRGRNSTAAAEAALPILVIALVAAGVFVGWIVGHYATPGKTKTVTVSAGQTQTTGASAAGAPPEVKSAAAEFPTPSGDLANTRATQGTIDSGNVKQPARSATRSSSPPTTSSSKRSLPRARRRLLRPTLHRTAHQAARPPARKLGHTVTLEPLAA
jgi:hypothetical protein